MEALADVVNGKARYIGFSEWTPKQIEAGLEAAVYTASRSFPPSRSTRCSGALRRTRSSPLCANHGIAQIVWSPLAEGVLTGKYEPGRPPPPTRERRATR